MGITVDTAFVIDVLRSEPAALAKARELDGRRETKCIATPVIYEVSAGLLFTRSRSEAAAFRELASRFQIAPLDEPSAMKAAEIQAELMRLGKRKAHTDVMIAGIAANGGHTLVTRDRDFADVAGAVGLLVEPY